MSARAYAAARGQQEAALASACAIAARKRHASRAHANVSDILLALGRRAEARDELAKAAALSRGAPEDQEALAYAAFRLGDHELSRDFYAAVAEMAPQDALAWYNLGTAERNLGRLEIAEAACNQALRLAPGLAQAALLRSHLRTQKPAANYVDDLDRRLASVRGDPAAEIFLNYALGKELDDLGDYGRAFAHFDRGARVRRQTLRYDVREDVWKLARIRETFDAGRLASAPPLASPAEHGFIIGLPRSGTTMVERVLTGRPDVVSNGETDNLVTALMAGAGESGDVFEQVADADPGLVYQDYQRRAGRGSARLMLEKLPLNYLYAGAIRMTLPTARIVLVSRAPADNAFAMFSTLFGNGYPFSYDLQDLATYMAAYRTLIAHWRATLGNDLAEVKYEAFVHDPTAEGRRVADHLQVGWREEMTRIEKNPAATATASAAQVRRPIYTSAVNRWRNYASQLAPLIAALEADGVDPDRG